MDDFNQRIRDLHDEAAGFLTCEVIRYSDLPALVLQAVRGDARAAQTLRTLDQFLSRVGSAKPQEPTLCVSCDRAVRQSRFACIIVSPSRDDARQALVFAICSDCAEGGSLAVIKTKIVAVLRSSVWPSLRVIRPDQLHPQGGRA